MSSGSQRFISSPFKKDEVHFIAKLNHPRETNGLFVQWESNPKSLKIVANPLNPIHSQDLISTSVKTPPEDPENPDPNPNLAGNLEKVVEKNFEEFFVFPRQILLDDIGLNMKSESPVAINTIVANL